MKILYLRLQASKILLALLLFNVIICIAAPPTLVPARLDKTGIQISEASCRGRVYKHARIYHVVRDALLYYNAQKKLGISLRDKRYFAKILEDMPIHGPFYFYQLYSSTPHKDNYRDFVVVTLKGELAKVVSGKRRNPSAPWRFEDCQLKDLMVPDTDDYIENQSIRQGTTGKFRKDLIIDINDDDNNNNNDLGIDKSLEPENWSLAINPQ